MKYLLVGMFLALIGTLASIVIWDIAMVTTITGGIGLFFIVIAFIISGAFVSGDRMRANLAAETVEGSKQRNGTVLHSVLIAIPNFAVAILFYFLLN